ncbi:MAG: hypothetical protein FP826_12400 [Sphingomonadales bacterium]|nr:hypothetical protein [Sphingomonadales bacterium]MBU3993149.1 hypothetical protein [Alphaproteobacteria bacterium]
MNPLSDLLLSGLYAPALAVLPVAGVSGGSPDASSAVSAPLAPTANLIDAAEAEQPVGEWQFRAFREMARAAQEAEAANQVRIEQRIIIRIAPATASRQGVVPPERDLRRSLFSDPRRRGGGSHFEERSMPQCVPVGGISGVQPDGHSRLVLFMRDQRIVSTDLGKACNARDFYSGFLVERSTDGMICAGRDKLLARTGSSCALGKLRQLIEVDDGD